MKQEELAGKVQTVLGIIDGDCLGVTLPHEHLLCDLASVYFVEPTDASEKKMAHEPVRMDNLYWVKRHCQTHVDNMKLMDEELAIKEAMMYKLAGGGTIVEMSNLGLSRDPLALARIARATGLNIIMGAGYYHALSHSPELSNMTEEEITNGVVRDIIVGVGSTGVRAGIIGEVGCSTPLDKTELRVLRACAAAQQRTGIAINIHPSATDDLVLEIIRILGDAGADLSRTVISHIDAFCFNRATSRSLADAGCYLEYDTFGYGDIFPPDNEGRYVHRKSDMQRISEIMELIGEGYLNHILISQDICFKHALVTYGGYGYAHILRDVVPVMRSEGMSDDQINTLLVENPKRVLTFASVKD